MISMDCFIDDFVLGVRTKHKYKNYCKPTNVKIIGNALVVSAVYNELTK